jgi:hypothetical protein
MPERLYKRAQLAHDNYEEGFLLSIDDFAPTASEVAAVEAEVDDIALTCQAHKYQCRQIAGVQA